MRQSVAAHALHYLTPQQRSPAVCLTAVQKCGWSVEGLTPEQRSPVVCLAAVQQCGWAVQFLTPEQRTPTICLAAVQQDGRALQVLMPKQRSPAVCLTAIRTGGLKAVILMEDEEVVLKCTKWTPELHAYYPTRTRHRIETVASVSTALPLEIAMGLAQRTPYIFS